jgi:glycosyltransferase involved in cell wall biosynthesis
MKILFLSQRFLLPMDTGGKIRTGNILAHLSKIHNITLVSNVELSKDISFIAEMKKMCSIFVPVFWKEVKRYTLRFYGRLTLQMFSLYPANVLNDYSRSLRNKLHSVYYNGDFDLAVCDFVQSALMFRNLEKIPKILFQHNVESIIMKRQFLSAKSPVSRIFWWLQWKKMERYERIECKKFQRIIAVSERDKYEFECLYGADNVDVIPTGVNIDFFKPFDQFCEEKNSIVFCGSMDWLPNEDAMEYFLEKILPSVRRRIPDASLTIVGRNPSPHLRMMVKRTSGILLTGWVEDIRPYIAKGQVIVVPLRIGGGTRLKIFEAMAMGKAVISTTTGAEGLPVTNGKNILIEDHPGKTANIVVELLSNRQKRQRIGNSAMVFVREHFAWHKVAKNFDEICRRTFFDFSS